jgi:hypothetical protein
LTLSRHRKFIREGALNFGENNSIKTKDGYVFLFNDIIVITEKTTHKTGTDYHYKDQVQLQLFRLEDDTSMFCLFPPPYFSFFFFNCFVDHSHIAIL